ncbi:uncharacterized protein MEPE_05958 [Melanopsichium pennsylvanicum]|uniref:Uncharacterized protein n=2 Tax=Melanopsichium pennsylvanicum TaxID=63383 RepID=A0AAJ4XTX0_9BASI|nr:hypothetical protein BN887_03793 [Melanopsichium pennsylvanicum 4]SNX87248.1 uncharacterized protein MEPE_05958 [Melanopsichium pennsylvanicum]
MALHQLFTLAFALHLEPLPTFNYAAVPYIRDPGRSTDSFEEPTSLRVGANTKLEPIYTRHLPHTVDTLSFLLNHTRAVDAVEPFAKLISLLEEADDDPEFRNLREFFDARYGDDGTLVGSDKDSRHRVRSLSRAASTKHPGRRPSHATEGRKSSFAASLGGATALKLNWLRRNNNADSHHHEASDDEDSHSRISSSGHASNPAPPSAPYIRLANRSSSSSPASSVSSSSHHAHHETITLVTFRVRLDLHTVGLAPPPPKLRSTRQPETSGSNLQRSGSGRSTSSSDWMRRRVRGSSLTSGGAPLRSVASSDSMASLGAVSAIANSNGDHSGFSRLAIETDSPVDPKAKSRLTPSAETPLTASAETNLPSITEGAVTSLQQPSSPTSGKPSRRPSMMSKLLDFGRKKSFLDRAFNDLHDNRSASPAPSHDDSSSQNAPAMAGHRASFRSHLGQHIGTGTSSNEEALDLEEEDDEGALRAQIMRKNIDEVNTKSRRRSSAGSSGKSHAATKPTSHDLRPVQEDDMPDLTIVSSRSSIGTTFSGHGIAEESFGGNVSAEGASRPSGKPRPAAFMDGGDFLSLFRAASTMGFESIGDPLDLQKPSSFVDGVQGVVTTPGQENVRSSVPGQAHVSGTGSTNTPSIRTPQVHPTNGSLPVTPGKSVRSLDLDRSPLSPSAASNPIDASFKLGASLAQNSGEEEAWWPCGDVDPLPVSVASALGQALGWEGIMHLCYGKGSRGAAEGNYIALGKAAALDQANKVQERSVLAWRTGVASAGTSPPKADQLPSLHELNSADLATIAGSLNQKLNLDSADPLPEATGHAALLERLHSRTPQRSSTVPAAHETPFAQQQATNGWAQTPLLFGTKVNQARTWEHWQALFRSIKGWVDEYEKARVHGGLAREIGLDRPVEPAVRTNEADSTNNSIILSAPINIEPASPDMHVPLTMGSPPVPSAEVLKVPRDKVDVLTLSKVLGASLSISPCVLADATNRAHGFRRRVGIPEGLPLGPEDEETIDYTWSRKKLSVEHFATALTISCDSTLHYLTQLATSNWLHRSAWELDYLEMCVFKSPLVADRFPPPGEAVVPHSQSYRPAKGTADRSRLCPNPDEAGAWDPDTWKRWLISIKEGDIIVPAIAWQAWWTLISVLNGADGTGRCYDLQVKATEEPFEALTDLNAVYL